MQNHSEENEELQHRYQEIEEEGEKEKPHILLIRDTTILVGLVSLLGYLVAYNYQNGYRGFYNLEDVFMNEITLTQVIISIASVLAMALGIFNMYPILKHVIFFDKVNPKWIISRFILKYLMLTPLVILYVFKFYLGSTTFGLIYICSLYFLLAIIPTVISSFFEEGNNYIQKVRNNISKPNEVQFVDILKFNVFDSTKGFILTLFIACVILGLISNLVGYSNASRKDMYYTFEYNKNDYIVVGEYDKKLIVAPFDKKNNSIIASYQIMESNSSLDSPITFHATSFKDTPKVKINQILK